MRKWIAGLFLILAMAGTTAMAAEPALLIAKRDRHEDRREERQDRHERSERYEQRGHDERGRQVHERRRIEPDEAAARAMRRHGGRVVGVQRQTSPEGEDYYSIKLLDGGRLRIINEPAER